MKNVTKKKGTRVLLNCRYLKWRKTNEKVNLVRKL